MAPRLAAWGAIACLVFGMLAVAAHPARAQPAGLAGEADQQGVIEDIRVAPGATVAADQVLIAFA